jgi:hypothetical protein
MAEGQAAAAGRQSESRAGSAASMHPARPVGPSPLQPRAEPGEVYKGKQAKFTKEKQAKFTKEKLFESVQICRIDSNTARGQDRSA